ncbi:alpha-galactosidase [Cohnella endophytica]|uniref:Alpha-galactosidase n=1 Tax=Cohnella endophytica TaxID=2419778 RepID=A0A494Y0E7_9BACL|nr:alpha-galactosidase [Cohnella endophytica]RKP53832.1 alpha-galactosidase [Cohnella endophytica]
MKIRFDENQKLFHLSTPNTSYVIKLTRGLYPTHIYWGRKLRSYRWEEREHSLIPTGFSPTPFKDDPHFSFDTLPQEYPGYGTGDYRHPAYQAEMANGTTATELIYEKHRIYSGKSRLEGLPSTYTENDDEARTLELELRDTASGLRVVLSYTVFRDHDAIARSARLINVGPKPLNITRALSMSVDFGHSDFDLLQLPGSWARERNVERGRLRSGTQVAGSSRGASSHHQNPFIALLAPNADEDQGDVYGFSLVYSGNFAAHAEVDQFRSTRVSMGINPFGFKWRLEAGESFQTPEAVLVYSDKGLGGMSRAYHRLYRTRLCRGTYRDRARPVLVNNWEGTYFDFNAEKIMGIAQEASYLGIELFVLDDGWFGKRDDDKSSLGDWFVNRRKLPGGLDALARDVNGLGLRFGLWFEPEMVSVDSELYRAHPDWCLHVVGRRRTEGRNQLILDLSREEVCQYLIESMNGILSSAPISYVKWDMNRHMTEIGSATLPPERQSETAHRYMLGLYRVMETVISQHPDVLFEGCSGGGGRFDPGMLYYMPQIWTSDNSDAVCRLKIQYGTSLIYPISSMGAHVSAVPNHQVHRISSLTMRGDVAMSGNFGYELDLTAMPDEEKAEVKRQVQRYKELRGLIQFGELYRLKSPFEGNDAAWMIVSEDRSEAYVSYYRVLAEPHEQLGRLRLKGLDPDSDYAVEGSVQTVGGDQLMSWGLGIPPGHGDFRSVTWHLRQK